MKNTHSAAVRFSIFLILGIISAFYFPVSFLFLEITICLFVLLIAFWIWDRKKLTPNILFGPITFLCFFLIGFFNYQIRLPQFQPHHFSHYTADFKSGLLQIKIEQKLKPEKFHDKYVGIVQSTNSIATNGKILLQIEKNTNPKIYEPDEIILVNAFISPLVKPLNPHDFDYAAYLNSLGIYAQTKFRQNDVLQHHDGNPTLKGEAENLRNSLIGKLKKTALKDQERSIIQALILGEKKDIQKDLYQNYAAAGAAHILAVSGLHVGILYLILGLLLSPLKRIKHGVFISAIILILLLWGFALLSGLSPSVTRAVTMFSFFALSQILNRQRNPINILFLSLLTLLLLNPLWLFQVGFQLSYLAVFFILWLYPFFKNIYRPQNLFLKKFYDIMAVSLCAQIGVLPLSLYYFHQFPGLFLLTNIVILPFISILMFGGLLIVLLANYEFLPWWLANGYNILLEQMNNFIGWIALQDKFLFSDIYISKLQTISFYLLILCFIFLIHRASINRIKMSLLSIIIFLSVSIYDKHKISSPHLIVFHKSKQSLMAYKNRTELTVFSNDTSKKLDNSYPLKTYIPKMKIKNIRRENLLTGFNYRGKKIIILDSIGVYPNSKPIEIILLTQSSKVNLNRLIDSLNPRMIIADGSNYTSYVARWEKTCTDRKLPFHHTAKTGAIILD